MRVGDKVRVAQLNEDDCADERFLGMTGEVVELDHGCGESEERVWDPMIIVEFVGGFRDGFWKEELELVV